MNQSMMILIAAVICMHCITSCHGLTCYQCANVEIKSGFFSALSGKTDPSCGAYPTGSNAVQCNYNEKCGSISGDLSVMGEFEAKIQVRGCMPPNQRDIGGGMTSISSSSFGCEKTDSLSNAVIGRMLSMATELPGVKFSGMACVCDFDYCALCDGGIDLGGYCFKYWALFLTCFGVLAVIIFLVSCCCCCCGCCGCCACCRKRAQGVVLSPPYHTLTVIQTPSVAPPSNPLSVQSGDISRQPANQNVACGGAAVGLVEDKERAGYNQKGDPFGASLA